MDRADEVAVAVVVDVEAAGLAADDDVVAHDRRSAADLEGAGGARADDEVALDDADPREVDGAVDLDAGALGVVDDVVADDAPAVELDLEGVADGGRVDAVEEVAGDEDVGGGAGGHAVVTAEVDAGGLEVEEGVVQDLDPLAVGAVGGDRDPADLLEEAAVDGDPRAALDLDGVDRGLRRAEGEVGDDDVAGEDVEDVGALTLVDDRGGVVRLGPAEGLGLAGEAAAGEGAGARVEARLEDDGVAGSGVVEGGAEVLAGGDDDVGGAGGGGEEEGCQRESEGAASGHAGDGNEGGCARARRRGARFRAR